MKKSFFIPALALAAGLLLPSVARSHDHDHDHDETAPQPPAERHTQVTDAELAERVKEAAAKNPATTPIQPAELPPLPDGVAEIEFKDFYKLPVGPRGLEPSEKLLALNGKRVRILGFMGRIHRESKREMIFAPMPLSPQPEEYGPADEIPAAHVLVTVPGNPDEELHYTPGLMLLTGMLSVGAQDGCTSFVRMQLDAPAPAAK